MKSFVLPIFLALGGPVFAAMEADVGDRAPDFELKDSKGQSYKLSDLKGKSVVVEFIRSGSW